MKIDGISIGSKHEPYVIAEVSANHNGNIETAKELINVAKIAGASAVKLQTYTPDTITLNSDSEDFTPWYPQRLQPRPPPPPY